MSFFRVAYNGFKIYEVGEMDRGGSNPQTYMVKELGRFKSYSPHLIYNLNIHNTIKLKTIKKL